MTAPRHTVTQRPLNQQEKALIAELRSSITRFMADQEASGTSFANASASASAAIGEVLLLLFAPLDDAYRQAVVDLFCQHLLRNVERYRTAALAKIRVDTSAYQVTFQ